MFKRKRPTFEQIRREAEDAAFLAERPRMEQRLAEFERACWRAAETGEPQELGMWLPTGGRVMVSIED